MCLVTTALEAVASQNVSTLSLRRDIQRHHFIPHGLGNFAALSVGYLQRQRSQVVSVNILFSRLFHCNHLSAQQKILYTYIILPQ